MTDIVVAKLQNRRGLRRDLPQPLSPGEIGFCIDTRELFIGADPTDPNSVISPEIIAYSPSAGAQTQIDMICSGYIVEINLNSGAIPPVDIDGVQKVLMVTRSDSSGVYNRTLYIGYNIQLLSGLPQPRALPSLGIGSERYFTNHSLVPTNAFINSALALSSSTGIINKYNVEDAGAVSTLINYVAGGNGVVTVNQNIRILTEVSGEAGNNDILHPFSVSLTASPSWSRINGFTYSTLETDMFLSDYSVNSFDPSYTNISPYGTYTGRYTRNGSIRILTCDNLADLSDQSTEINNGDIPVAFFLKAVYNAGNVELWYMTTPGATRSFIVSFNTHRWISF